MRAFLLFMTLVFISASATYAHAQDKALDVPDLPPLSAQVLEANAPIKLTPDGPAVIKLGRDAASVIIGNPAHASVMMESPRMLMIMPGQPGATKIMVLDADGKAILNRHVLVSNARSGFLRIKRVCAAVQGTGACQPYSIYYCPDKCYISSLPQDGTTSTSAAPAVSPDQQPVADMGTNDPGVGILQ